MSIRILSAVWEDGPSGRLETLVLMALADFSDSQGFSFPSVRTICEKARSKERAVRGALQTLEDEGWLCVDRERALANGKQTSNGYQINLERLGLAPAKNAAPLQNMQGPPAKNAAPKGVQKMQGLRTHQFNPRGRVPDAEAARICATLGRFAADSIRQGKTVLVEGTLLRPDEPLAQQLAERLERRRE